LRALAFCEPRFPFAAPYSAKPNLFMKNAGLWAWPRRAWGLAIGGSLRRFQRIEGAILHFGYIVDQRPGETNVTVMTPIAFLEDLPRLVIVQIRALLLHIFDGPEDGYLATTRKQLIDVDAAVKSFACFLWLLMLSFAAVSGPFTLYFMSRLFSQSFARSPSPARIGASFSRDSSQCQGTVVW
jgi:hypothetical protein